MSILNRFYNTIWAIESDHLRFLESVVKERPALNIDDMLALEAKKSAQLEGSPNGLKVVNDGATAIIPIVGAITRYAGLFDSLCDLTSTEGISYMLNEALENPDIENIVLNFDTPGGDSRSLAELAEMIYEGRKVKDIHAYIGGSAYSAGAWLAAAATTRTIASTGGFGSIGVIIYADDDTELRESIGIKEIVIRNTLSPNKAPSITTEKGQKQITDRLDALADVFFNDMAKYLSNDSVTLTASDIIKKFKEGGTLLGKEALQAGVVDKVGTLQGLLKQLKEKKMAKEKEEVADNATAEEIIKLKEQLEEANTIKEMAQSAQERATAAEKALEEARAELETQSKDLEGLSELREQSAELKKFVEQSKATILDNEANTKATELSKNLSPDQKPMFVELYKSVEGVQRESLVKFVEANKGIQTLKEDVLSTDNLRELPNVEVDVDELAQEKEETKAYLAKLKRGGK